MADGDDPPRAVGGGDGGHAPAAHAAAPAPQPAGAAHRANANFSRPSDDLTVLVYGLPEGTTTYAVKRTISGELNDEPEVTVIRDGHRLVFLSKDARNAALPTLERLLSAEGATPKLYVPGSPPGEGGGAGFTYPPRKRHQRGHFEAFVWIPILQVLAASVQTESIEDAARDPATVYKHTLQALRDSGMEFKDFFFLGRTPTGNARIAFTSAEQRDQALGKQFKLKGTNARVTPLPPRPRAETNQRQAQPPAQDGAVGGARRQQAPNPTPSNQPRPVHNAWGARRPELDEQRRALEAEKNEVREMKARLESELAELARAKEEVSERLASAEREREQAKAEREQAAAEREEATAQREQAETERNRAREDANVMEVVGLAFGRATKHIFDSLYENEKGKFSDKEDAQFICGAATAVHAFVEQMFFSSVGDYFTHELLGNAEEEEEEEGEEEEGKEHDNDAGAPTPLEPEPEEGPEELVPTPQEEHQAPQVGNDLNNNGNNPRPAEQPGSDPNNNDTPPRRAAVQKQQTKQTGLQRFNAARDAAKEKPKQTRNRGKK